MSQGSVDAGSHDVSDAEDKELPYITDIEEWVDLSHLFHDAAKEQDGDTGPAEDISELSDAADAVGHVDATLEAAKDALAEAVSDSSQQSDETDAPESVDATLEAAKKDALAEAISDSSQLSDATDVGESVDATLEAPEDGLAEEVSSANDTDATDVVDEDIPSIFNDCEELGIGNHWAGTFEGEIIYELTAAEGINLIPEGILPVSGDLAFDIECIDSKLAVSGAMDGVGTVVGQGEFPFAITLAGYYSPQTGELDADIVEGMVSIYDLVQVYFEGKFEGSLLTDNTFTGIWTGVYLGSNLGEQITGEANGLGTWVASEATE